MSKLGPVSLLATILLVAASAAVRVPGDGVLGVRLGMSKETVLERMAKIGQPTSDQGEESVTTQQWLISDPGYARIVVNFDGGERVQWISVFARPGGRGVRFSDVGDLRRARKRGDYVYAWSVPAKGRRSPYQVIARSQNPDTLQSLSVVRLPSSHK